MEKKEFKFLEAYRLAAPTATREVVEARKNAHDKLFQLLTTQDKVYDLCRIAFNLPFDARAVAEWFERPIKEADIHFSLDLDKAEAARVATLLLRDLVWRGDIVDAIASLVASYCGKRAPTGGTDLLVEARQAISVLSRERRIVLADEVIALPPGKSLQAELDAMQNNLQGPTVRAALDAMSTSLRDGASKVANAANDSAASLRGDVMRLAEEVDMLWWYIGDWSELLEKSRSALTEPAVAVVSAIELGELVREVPGPYGVYGLLRRALGKTADVKTSLKLSIEGIETQDLSRLTKPLPVAAQALFPIQAAVNLAADRGTKHWSEVLESMLGAVSLTEVSHYDLAIQAFRERLLIGYGDLGQ